MTDRDWHQAASAGWEFTSRGEVGIRDAFDLLERAAPSSGHQQSPIAAFGGLYRWLDSGGHRIDRGPIREILRNHVLETRRFVPGRRFLGRTRPTLTPKNMTVDSPAG